MKYLPTAFAQLQFAWKLYHQALEGALNVETLDVPLTFQEGNLVFVLPDRIFDSQNDLIVACENNLGIAFGAAAITLNRAREEADIRVPQVIETEVDQFVALAYQIRNAFAHDIAEPTWEIRSVRYEREYRFGAVRIDLRGRNRQVFRYADVGGPEVLFSMYEYATQHVW